MTIHDIGVALQTYLLSQSCPFPVVDGPEVPKPAGWGRERIVLEHDQGGDSFAPPRGLHLNARHVRTVTDNYKLTIYARSSLAGASVFEHRERALSVRETVIAGIYVIAARNKNRWDPKSGSLVVPADLAASDALGGAAYELKFTYETPIRVVTFRGDARPEGTVGALTSTTNVSRAGAADDDTETACGA